MPAFSPTILIKHIYQHPVRLAELRAAERSMNPSLEAPPPVVDERSEREQAFEDFLQFYENMYEELSKFGRIEALNVCDNLGDHMIGHVYAKFTDEEEAADALHIMNGRYYDGRKMEVEFSPVTDFREARCRDFDEETW
jgi:splicing factor U2AF subunit